MELPSSPTSEAHMVESSGSLSSALHPIRPLAVEDVAPTLCGAYRVKPSPTRPCYMLRGLLSGEECASLLEQLEQYRAAHLNTSTSLGCRSEFSHDDPELSSIIWERIKSLVPLQLDGELSACCVCAVLSLVTQVARP